MGPVGCLRSNYSQQYKDEVLEAFEVSSLSGAAFASQCGIKYSTFASWRAKARRQSSAPKPQLPETSFLLAEVAPAKNAPHSGLSVEFPGGITAQVHDEAAVQLLAALINALR